MTVEKLNHCITFKGGWIGHVVKRLSDVAIYRSVKRNETSYFVLDIYTVPRFDISGMKIGHCEMFVFVEPYKFRSYTSAKDRAIELLNFE